MSSQVGDEITYPFPNFNGCTVEVWEWISNFTLHSKMDVIDYPSWIKIFKVMLAKRAQQCVTDDISDNK